MPFPGVVSMYSVVRSVATFAAVGCLGLTLACGTDVSIAPFSTDERATTSVTSGSGEATHEVRLAVGETAGFEVERRQYQRFMRYATDNPDVADVSAGGTIVGVSPGSATVRATFGDYVAVANVRVSATVYGNPEDPLFSIAPRAGAPLAVGASRQYWVYTDWSPSELASMGITYTATGGTITNMGVFTAGPVAGSFMVIAHCLCGLADTAVVTVSSTAAQLRELHISPKTVSLDPGEVQQFSVTANWSTGASTLPPISYSSTAGSVSSVGRFTAPGIPGTYLVVVSHTGGVLRDTSVVSVRGQIAPPPTGGGGGPEPTPPPPSGGDGAAPFFQDDFETGTRVSANGFTWSVAGKVHVRTDQSYSGDYALKFRFGPDSIGQDSDSEQRFNLGRNLPELWVEYYLYIPENFVMRSGPGPMNNKFFGIWANRYSKTGDVQVVTEYERSGPDSSIIRVLSMSGRANVTARKHAGLLDNSMRGRWMRVRVHVKTSTGENQNDGIIELWKDNTLVYSHYEMDIWFAGGNNFWRTGYLLGWANTGFTEETSFFIDDVKFWDASPGWR